MNEELANKLGNIVDIIARGMTTVGDFVLTELPDVAQQYVLYGRISELVWVLILVAFWIFFVYTLFHKGFYNKTKLDEDSRSMIFFVCVVISIILSILLLIHIKEAMLVWFAPKIWLLQEVANLVKTVKGK